MNDNQDLQRISGRLLAMITSITPSLELIEPLMDALMSILQSAEVSNPNLYDVKLTIQSWRTKVHCMPVLSLVYYRNLSLLSESCKARALDVVALCLRDPNQEVREIASAYVFAATLVSPADTQNSKWIPPMFSEAYGGRFEGEHSSNRLLGLD